MTPGILGIDPGLGGAMALLFEDGTAELHNMPLKDKSLDVVRLILMLTEMRERVRVAVLEHVQPMRFNGCIGSFKLGQAFGEIRTSLISAGIPIMLARPAVWSKEFPMVLDRTVQRGALTGAIKKGRAAIAQEMFKGVDLELSPKAKNPHDGRVDALLIAEYGRRKINKGEWHEQAGN